MIAGQESSWNYFHIFPRRRTNFTHMLSQDLKKSTENIHKEAEKIMVRWLKRIRSPEDYVVLLNWLYGYYGPIEHRIKSQLSDTRFPDMPRRTRADDLLRDMQQAGIPLPAPEHCPDLPVIDSFGKALGALYVLEGSTLGGRVIAAMLAHQLGSEKSISYFSSYGSETEDMWQSFRDFLDSNTTPEVSADALQAANATFITFKNWIEKHELQPELRF
jgi:heme oxygenase